jgi:hypothetical protein
MANKYGKPTPEIIYAGLTEHNHSLQDMMIWNNTKHWDQPSRLAWLMTSYYVRYKKIRLSRTEMKLALNAESTKSIKDSLSILEKRVCSVMITKYADGFQYC